MSLGSLLIPELQALKSAIAQKNTYYGNKISPSIMEKFEIEERPDGAGIIVPYWISILQEGRGPRKSNKSHGLSKIIYNWMRKNNMFEATTTKGKLAEARFITWYINRYGTKQFRKKVFVDIYKTEREKTINRMRAKFSLEIGKITTDIL
jgi:hypothetical protein